MHIRWKYDTSDMICIGLTRNPAVVDDSDDAVWTADDPAAPDGVDLQPTKKYEAATHTVRNATRAEDASRRLKLRKQDRNEEIDRQTRRLMQQGVRFEGQLFPLATEDLLCYQILYTNRNDFNVVSWPNTIATAQLDTFRITSAGHMKSFGEAAFARQLALMDGARDLKKQLFDAATIAAVDAIVDSRT